MLVGIVVSALMAIAAIFGCCRRRTLNSRASQVNDRVEDRYMSSHLTTGGSTTGRFYDRASSEREFNFLNSAHLNPGGFGLNIPEHPSVVTHDLSQQENLYYPDNNQRRNRTPISPFDSLQQDQKYQASLDSPQNPSHYEAGQSTYMQQQDIRPNYSSYNDNFTRRHIAEDSEDQRVILPDYIQYPPPSESTFHARPPSGDAYPETYNRFSLEEPRRK